MTIAILDDYCVSHKTRGLEPHPTPASHPDGDHQQRVAIRMGARRNFTAHHTVRARPVLDDRILPPCFGALAAHHARRDVGRNRRT